MQKLLLGTALAVALVLPAMPCLAQAAEEGGDDGAWSVSGGVTAVSDYVWRGVSQTQGDPTLQGELTLEHASGFYAGAWASGVDFTAPDDEDDGIDYELDGYIGWAGDLGEHADLDVFLSRVTYPGAKSGYGIDYTEIEATLGFAEYYHVGMAYSPDIFKLGARGLYYNAGAEFPLGDSGFNLKLQTGWYDLDAAAGDSYGDYLVGVSREFGPIHAELQYTDTYSYGPELSENLDDADQADGRVALLVGWKF